MDRAALDFALKYKFSCGGWCPRGRKAEDGSIPIHYPLKETSTASYDERTKQNIIDSDASLILYTDVPDRGTKQAIEFCISLKKPVLYHSLTEKPDFQKIRVWLKHYNVQTLNIAGPRESNAPGIYEKSYNFLGLLFKIHE